MPTQEPRTASVLSATYNATRNISYSRKKKGKTPFQAFSTEESRAIVQWYKELKKQNPYYRKKLEEIPIDTQQKLADAKTFYDSGHYDEAQRIITEVLQEGEDSAEVYMLAGQIWWRKREWKEALAMITHSLQIHPYQPMGYYIRGDCYMKIKDYVSAALELEKYLKVAKPTKEVLQNLGKCKATNQDLEGAIACFTQIIEKEDNDPYIYFLRGDCYDRMNLIEKAKEDYKKILELDPDFCQPYVKEALEAQENGKYEKAIDILIPVIKIEPNNPYHYKRCAECYISLGEQYHNDALEMLERAIKLFKDGDPERDDAYFYKAALQDKLGQTKEAIETYTMCLNINPEHVGALQGRARDYRSLGDDENAFIDFDKFVSLQPEGNPDAHSFLAEMSFKKGNLEKALNHYTRAFAANGICLKKTKENETLREQVALCIVTHLASIEYQKAEDIDEKNEELDDINIPVPSLVQFGCAAHVLLYPDFEEIPEPVQQGRKTPSQKPPSRSKSRSGKKPKVEQKPIEYNEVITKFKEIWKQYQEAYQKNFEELRAKRKKLLARKKRKKK